MFLTSMFLSLPSPLSKSNEEKKKKKEKEKEKEKKKKKKILRNKFTKNVPHLHDENYKTLKEILKHPNNWKKSYVHTLKDLIFLRWQYFPSCSRNSRQSHEYPS